MSSIRPPDRQGRDDDGSSLFEGRLGHSLVFSFPSNFQDITPPLQSPCEDSRFDPSPTSTGDTELRVLVLVHTSPLGSGPVPPPRVSRGRDL